MQKCKCHTKKLFKRLSQRPSAERDVWIFGHRPKVKRTKHRLRRPEHAMPDFRFECPESLGQRFCNQWAKFAGRLPRPILQQTPRCSRSASSTSPMGRWICPAISLALNPRAARPWMSSQQLRCSATSD